MPAWKELGDFGGMQHPLPSGHGHHITDLECWNLFVALKVWGSQLCGRRIILKCWNITLEYHLSTSGEIIAIASIPGVV